MKRTKIVCTLGPASNTLEKIVAMVDAGMDVARLNFSHGTYEDHKRRIELVRQASRVTKKDVSILQDLQGPKIRIGKLESPSVELIEGNTFEIQTTEILGNEQKVSTTYTKIVDDVTEGDIILIDDGLLKVRVIGKEKDKVITEVLIGGTLKPNKGLNLPDVVISIPSLTEKDIKDVEFGVQIGVDLIALSFVRSGKDVEHLRELIASYGRETWIVAKIEKPQAIANLDEIIKISNGIMVARGDLGVEMKSMEVPVLQKEIVRKCNLANIPVIIATQMLETMTHTIIPTRAETSDIANAVFDGTDAVMLSAETASGLYPLESLKTMCNIITAVENSKTYHVFERVFERRHRRASDGIDENLSQAIANSAVIVAKAVNAKVMIVLSHSGQTAIRVSKQRSDIQLLVITDSVEVHRRMNLVWGVHSILARTFIRSSNMFEFVESKIKDMDLAKKGDTIIYTLGIPVLERGTTDTIKVSVLV